MSFRPWTAGGSPAKPGGVGEIKNISKGVGNVGASGRAARGPRTKRQHHFALPAALKVVVPDQQFFTCRDISESEIVVVGVVSKVRLFRVVQIPAHAHPVEIPGHEAFGFVPRDEVLLHLVRHVPRGELLPGQSPNVVIAEQFPQGRPSRDVRGRKHPHARAGDGRRLQPKVQHESFLLG